MSLESKRVMPFVQNLDPILHLDLCSKDVCIWKESNHYTNYKLKKSVACFFKLKFMARKSRRWIGPHVKTVWVVNLEFKIRIQIWSQNSDFCFRISALFSEVQVSFAEFRLFFFLRMWDSWIQYIEKKSTIRPDELQRPLINSHSQNERRPNSDLQLITQIHFWHRPIPLPSEEAAG